FERETREAAFLDAVLRLPRHVPDPALARCAGDAAPRSGLSARTGLRVDERVLLDRGLLVGGLDAAVPVERVPHMAPRAVCGCGRPVGLCSIAGVGHELPAPAAQFHQASPGPVRTPRL